MTDKPPYLTHAAGAPVSVGLSIQTAGRRGPAPLRDRFGDIIPGQVRGTSYRIMSELRTQSRRPTTVTLGMPHESQSTFYAPEIACTQSTASQDATSHEIATKIDHKLNNHFDLRLS